MAGRRAGGGARAGALLFSAVLLAHVAPVNSFTMPPPWVVLWGAMAFAKTFAVVKDIVLLVIDVIFGGEGAACTLCDKIITVLLSGEAEGGMDELDCTGLCFRLDRCIKICEKLKVALSSSASFPCVAAGYCPQVDEFGPMPKCVYKFPASCAPANMCAFKFPKCELSDGYKKWRKMNAMLTENLGAVAGALTKMPKCGEPGAHKTFCVNEPTGIGAHCKNFAYALYLWACAQSVMAIESPGGDDDRQWLSFWIIFLIFTVFEAMTDVLLSWLPSYYEMKFIFLCWLIFFNGADILYRKVHSLFSFLRSLLVKLGLIEDEEEEEWDEEDFLHELPNGLADDIRHGGGIQKVFSEISGPKDIEDRFGERKCAQLLRQFDKTQPRWVDVTLVKAEGLAAMDSNGFSDPYCVLCLVAPPQAFAQEHSNRNASFRNLTNFFGSFLGGKKADGPEAAAATDGEPADGAPTAAASSAEPGADKAVAQKGAVSGPARAKWSTVKKKMVEPARISNCLAGLKRSISDPSLAELGAEVKSRLDRSNSHDGSLTEVAGAPAAAGEAQDAQPKMSLAAAGIAGMFAKHMSSAAAVVSGGPVGPRYQYAKVRSKIIPRTLNPVYDQFFEMHLEGGTIDKNGDYRNPHAPFNKLRLTVWDNDALSRDDFMGECTVPLGPLMSSRTLEGWYDLEDPEGAYENDDGKPLSGRVYLKLKWNSEALLPGSMRPKKEEEAVEPESPVTPAARHLASIANYNARFVSSTPSTPKTPKALDMSPSPASPDAKVRAPSASAEDGQCMQRDLDALERKLHEKDRKLNAKVTLGGGGSSPAENGTHAAGQAGTEQTEGEEEEGAPVLRRQQVKAVRSAPPRKGVLRSAPPAPPHANGTPPAPEGSAMRHAMSEDEPSPAHASPVPLLGGGMCPSCVRCCLCLSVSASVCAPICLCLSASASLSLSLSLPLSWLLPLPLSPPTRITHAFMNVDDV